MKWKRRSWLSLNWFLMSFPIVSATSSPFRESKWMLCSTDLWERAQEGYPPPIWITTKVINQGDQCCPRPEFLNQLRWQYLNRGPQFPISWLVKKLVLIVIITDTFRDIWDKQDLINDEFPYSWQLLVHNSCFYKISCPSGWSENKTSIPKLGRKRTWQMYGNSSWDSSGLPSLTPLCYLHICLNYFRPFFPQEKWASCSFH